MNEIIYNALPLMAGLATVFGAIFGSFRWMKAILLKDIHRELSVISLDTSELKNRLIIMDERIFLLATGKTLAEAIKEEKLKESKQ